MASLTLAAGETRPLVAHVVYRFAVGGLENGVVNLINHLPVHRWRHAVVALDSVDPVFASRIQVPGVTLHCLNKPPGHGYRMWPAWIRLLRRLKPQIVHSRNLAALEAQIPAWWVGVPGRVHSEHGRDLADVDGTNLKHLWMRRLYLPFVHQTIALGQELTEYSANRVGVPKARLRTVYNGVDTERFTPPPNGRKLSIPGCPFDHERHWLIGTVGRMQTVKAQPILVRAFTRLVSQFPALRERARLVVVGEGPLRAECELELRKAGIESLAWFAGERGDIPSVMRGLDCFVLPSLTEGISNTILEAMASGLPVIATDVGANSELVVEGVTGFLVAPGRDDELAVAISSLASDSVRSLRMGRLGLERVQSSFSLGQMVTRYEDVYQSVLDSWVPG